MMMKNLTNRLSILIALTMLSAPLFSQGVAENELSTNHVIVNAYNELQSRSALRTPFITDTLTLGTKGIVDDFSYDGPYPDSSVWMDRDVFINRDFAKAPITLGVATFDGLDQTGYPRNFSASSTSFAVSDYLSSKPINLYYPASDSIYLSFFYQPQGRGNAPEYTDSLVLEFRNPSSASTAPWNHIWAKKGTTLSGTDSSWTLVMIPIKDTAFLKNGFRFRFKNYATLSGNTDHWNLDYVYLNRIRNRNDTAFNDVSFVYNGTPLLKNYTEMPWEQFKKSELRDSVTNLLRYNNTGVPYTPVSYGHQITDDFASTVLSNFVSGGTFNLLPYATTHVYTQCDFAAGCLKTVAIDTTTFPAVLTAPTRFSITHFIGATNLNPENDTLVVHQNLFNSYAYDDGTAENSFGMSTNHAKLAEQFTLNIPDSLQFIDIFFNPFLTNTSVYTFNLKVWIDGGGIPGPAIYTGSTVMSPAYGTTYNQFTRYKLDAPLYLPPGKFYVGFEQNTTQFLNVGEDKNTNSQTKIFYNTLGTWNSSPFAGSLMLHPVFGSYSQFTGVEEVQAKKENTYTLYPNPANDRLSIRSDDNSSLDKIDYTITDVVGKIVIASAIYDQPIDISMLKDGIYFIRMNDGIKISISKFIKLK